MRAGPRHKEPARHDQHPAQSADSRVTVARGAARVVELAAYRELCACSAAAEHLNAQGVTAARMVGAVWP
jgi:hypothetical protein